MERAPAERHRVDLVTGEEGGAHRGREAGRRPQKLPNADRLYPVVRRDGRQRCRPQPRSVAGSSHAGVDTGTVARDKRAAGPAPCRGSNRVAGPRVGLTDAPSERFRGGGVETGLEDPTIAWDRP